MRGQTLFLSILLFATGAQADTPASAVTTTAVPANGHFAEVPAGGEAWFDVGGFCKVVDADPAAGSGVPAFIPSTAEQWEIYRTSGTGMTKATCCRPQTNIANLCTEAGAAVVEVSRQYGKNGEVDTVAATCIDQWGQQYIDSVNVSCRITGGGADGPDMQGAWVEVGADVTSSCTPNAFDTGCYAACDSTSSGTRYDSCGNPSAYTCSGGACPPPPTPPSCTMQCNPLTYSCAGVTYNDCGGTPDSCGGSNNSWECVASACTPCECYSNVAGQDSGPGCCVEAGNCAP